MTDGREDEEPTRARRRSRLVLPVLTSLVAVGVLFVGVFPTRAIMEQRRELADAEASLAFIEARNDELEARVDALGTDAEIERIAREQYNLGRPGEEVYAILPAPPGPPAVPDAWPFRGLHDAVALASP
jgi:cell division protein FtsB